MCSDMYLGHAPFRRSKPFWGALLKFLVQFENVLVPCILFLPFRIIQDIFKIIIQFPIKIKQRFKNQLHLQKVVCK